jgi:hypothetical protein
MLYGALVSQQPPQGKALDASVAATVQPARWYAMVRQQKLPFGLSLSKPPHAAGQKSLEKGRP